jgi:hypothetical protein
MKTKILFTAILALLFSNGCFSQKSILKLQVGYGIPLVNDSQFPTSIQLNSSSTTYTSVYGSYGSGLRFEVGYIRPLSTHLALEIDATYLSGKAISSTYNSSTTFQSQTSSARFYEISPMLRVNLGGDKVKPYGAIGPVIGFGTTTADYVLSRTGATNAKETQVRYSGSAAIGAKSVVGVELTQGKFIFYAQITMIAMSYAPTKSEYTKYTLNGTDQLSQLTISQKQFVYKGSVTVTGNSPDPSKPTEQLKFYLPFSNISMDVGVMFKF